ncbi:MAG: hypothetical protein U0R19_00930 [Bryobacteraceae bacterium]
MNHILAALLVTILIVAGPCPACPAPQPEKSAHDCCPGGKTHKKAPSTEDCPLIAYYLDVTKDAKSTQHLLAMWATAPVAGATAPVETERTFAAEQVAASASPSGRYSYLFLSQFLI